MANLIADGFLVRPIAKKPDHQFDLTNIRTKMGEYVQQDLDALAGDDEKIRLQVSDALSRLNGRNKIAWQCVSIDHCEKIKEELKRQGELAACIHSNLEKELRYGELRSFKEGSARHMTFVTILSEGYDQPSIDALVLMRPTRSSVMWVQTAGRALRPYPGKENALILDYGRITENLGPLDNPVIKTAGKGKKQDSTPVPQKFCPSCLSYLHISIMECPDCGHEFVKEPLKKVELTPDEQAMLLSTPCTFIAQSYSVHDHLSKSGNECVYIQYSSEFSDLREYFVKSNWCKPKLDRRLKELEGDGKIEVTYRRDGKFNKIIGVRRVSSDRARA
jgi:DNA repair protein RadD